MVNRVRANLWWVGVLLVMPAAAAGQQPVPLLGARARLADFGLTVASDVLRGRVSVAHTPGGPVLGVYFLRDHPRPAPASPEGAAEPPVVPDAGPEAGVGLVRPEGLWVWNTRSLLADAEAKATFLAFVDRHRFARIFLQLPAAPDQRVEAGFVPFDGVAVGALVESLAQLGARVYALDGDPSYALEENHAGVFRTVDRVLEHNRQAASGQRFFGVRYDVEPYLAPGFQGPRRQELLDGYVALVAGLSRRAHAGGLALGVDLPFWLDGADEETGEPLAAVLHGERRTVLDHVLAHVDDVAVMDYRTDPTGMDGSVAHARAELEAAAATGTGVMVAVETETLVDEELYTFSGTGWSGLPADSGRWIVLTPETGDDVRLWFVDGPAARAELADALAGAGKDLATVRHWPAGRPALVPADKQSFRGLGSDRMRRETAREAAALARYPAFLGLAYHNYESLRLLLEEGR